MSTTNKNIAVITGASRGLGYRIAKRLGTSGTKVVLVARSEESLKELAAEIELEGGVAMTIAADLSRYTEAEADMLRRAVEDKLGSPGILINAAGIFGPFAYVKDSDPMAWVDTQMVNLISPYLLMRALLPGMLEQGWGRIINVTSAASLHPPGPLNSAYGVSKVGLNQLTRHLASEIQGSGVTANVIHPGEVKTEMWSDIKNKVATLGPEGEAYASWVEMVGKTGGDDPEKAADLILELIDDASANLNGTFQWIKAGIQSPIPSWENNLDQSLPSEAGKRWKG